MAEVTSSSVKMEEDVANTDAKEDTPKHPYHLQLAEFQPNAWQLEEREPQKYLPLEETKPIVVDSQELLDEMMTKLREVKEFAMDLQHHSYRSFTGFICLVKISTRAEDFIVDAIKLKEEITVLNEVCTDPNILKVFHGSTANILWLQRDFGIYIVNMFDTLEASRDFNQKLSFGRLLKEVCDIEVEKKFHLADWRVRPLPEDMFDYARESTHYLLYIFDIYTNKSLHGKVKTEKVDTTLLIGVYERSTKLCGLVHSPPVFKEESYKNSYSKIRRSLSKAKGTLTSRQLECFRLLYAWRYDTAQEHDESTAYTLPNKVMFQIAKDLPKNAEEFSTCVKTLPPLLEPNVTHVLTLVKKAIDDIPDVPVVANKSARGKGKPAGQLLKKKPICFVCGKTGHLSKDCYHKRAAAEFFPLHRVRKDPYGMPPRGGLRGAFRGGFGNPRGDRRGALGGGFGNPRGDFHRGAYGGGYGSRGFHPAPQPYSGYEKGYDHFAGYQPNPRPLFPGYGAARPRFGYY